MINTAHNTKRLIIGLVSITEKFEVSAQWADAAYAVRDTETVKKVADSFISADSPAYAPIGYYFAGSAVVGDDPTTARIFFQRALDGHDQRYRDRAQVGIVATLIYAGDYSTAIKVCERLRNSQDEYTYLESHRAMAMAFGLDGDTRKEIEILEAVYPAVKQCSEHLAHLRLKHANNKAAALNESGRFDEAEKWAEAACSSSLLTSRFPEFEQTRNEIAEAKAAREKAASAISMYDYRRARLQEAQEKAAIRLRVRLYMNNYQKLIGLRAMENAVVRVGEEFGGLIKKPSN